MTPDKFSPPWWARSPHIQTILPVLTKEQSPKVTRERLELADGDFIDLDWCGQASNGKPVLVLIHGLEGSSESHYARRMLNQCHLKGLTAVVHHHRSCSGLPNRLARSYHSGDTEDLGHTLTQIRTRLPDSPIWACGYSLGGNIVTKYLGETGSDSLIDRAVVVSAPLQLGACAERLKAGFSRVYQNYLIRQLQAKTLEKVNHPQLGKQMPLDESKVRELTTFHQFDDAVTAPLHGFKGVQDYYQRASGMPFLAKIQVPTLVLHAGDDPFMTSDVIPPPNGLAPNVEYELQPLGGHVGFINGGLPWRPRYYLEPRILYFLTGES
ncbi:hydrolase [Shewanella corallii]|uniref:Hydrolase n=1 Tax=Shewanella corallii TaxID=560080 RepID=A0ABT0NC62_9GAMM|nr:hydrolase [Shewanella corallii]MCL2915960.1 hydrolase [Shewanella corallii]